MIAGAAVLQQYASDSAHRVAGAAGNAAAQQRHPGCGGIALHQLVAHLRRNCSDVLHTNIVAHSIVSAADLGQDGFIIIAFAAYCLEHPAVQLVRLVVHWQ